jgi:hypothetical protein
MPWHWSSVVRAIGYASAMRPNLQREEASNCHRRGKTERPKGHTARMKSGESESESESESEKTICAAATARKEM